MTNYAIGMRILVLTVTKELLTIQGKRATIIDVDGGLIQAKTDDGRIFGFDVEGKLGITVAEVKRSDLAKDIQTKIDQLEAEFTKKANALKAEITRLGFDSDEAYEKSQFKAAVLEAIKV